MSSLEKELKAENLSESKKWTLCNQMEEPEWIRITRSEVCTQELLIFRNFRGNYQAVQAQQGLWKSSLISVIHIGC